jgi:uncharacterized repeat protein (TIGR02543 family)
MKRRQLFSWMLGIAVASAIALTGCDDVLENGSETPAYSIVLSEDEAYVFKSAETELALLVVNTGDEATGALTAELLGDSEAFTLSKTKLPSIKAGKSGTLVIAPVAGLAAGVYKAAVVLSGEKGVAATLDVSFAVGEDFTWTDDPNELDGYDPDGERPDEPVRGKDPELGSYGISLNVNVNEYYNFPPVIEGYGEYAPLTITVTNTLSQPTGTLTLNLGSAAFDKDAARFTLSTDTLQSIEMGETATFTIAPKTGISHGGYSDYMEIHGDNGIWARFGIGFVIEGGGSPDDAIHTVHFAKLGGLYVDVNEYYSDVYRVRHGFTVKQLADVFKPGYTFGGWYRDLTYKTPWNFDTDTVTATMVLYAKWVAVTEEEGE